MAESRAETLLLKDKGKKKKRLDFQLICAVLSCIKDLAPRYFHITNTYKKGGFKIVLKGQCS